MSNAQAFVMLVDFFESAYYRISVFCQYGFWNNYEEKVMHNDIEKNHQLDNNTHGIEQKQ